MQKHKLPFQTVLIDEPVASHSDLSELIRWGRLFHDRGWAPSYGEGSQGNLSVRTPSGCLISATKTFLGDIQEEQFVEIVGCKTAENPPTVTVRGVRDPSTDSLIHWHLYHWRAEVGAVLHAHDPLVLAAVDRLNLPQTEREAPPGSPDLLELIRPLAQEPYFLVKGHGFVATGQSIDAAGRLALSIREEVEATIAD